MIIDDFEDLSPWSVSASEGVEVEIAQDAGVEGMGMRLDFDFHGAGGFLIAHRPLRMALPDNYSFTVWVRGDAPQNNLEFKLVDPQGQNVWWNNRRNFQFPHDWTQLVNKKRNFRFAWGPQGGGVPREVGAIEIAISSGNGGKGSVWIDSLGFRVGSAASAVGIVPQVLASTTAKGYQPGGVVDTQAGRGWRSGSLAEAQWLQLDMGRLAEYGGLVIDWDREDFARDYAVEISTDGKAWRRVYDGERSRGGREYIYLPDSESRYIRLQLRQSSRGQGYAIHSLRVEPSEFGSSRNTFFSAVAHDSRRGLYPRYLTGEQSQWTVVGVAGDREEALINEDGMVELAQGRFSVEPFVYRDGALLTWDGARRSLSLDEGYLPIPSVRWREGDLDLDITAVADGERGHSSAFVRYLLENRSDQELSGDLYLAVRPFQVNPSWQSLNSVGGVGQIHAIGVQKGVISIDGERWLFTDRPEAFGATTFGRGALADYLAAGTLPDEASGRDEQVFAAGAVRFHFTIPAHGRKAYHLLAPLHPFGPELMDELRHSDLAVLWKAARERARKDWAQRLNRVQISLPESAQDYVDTLRTNLAYILINQDGPALQPGSRAYARSWIRDGALISRALLELGHTEPVRDFIRWYAGYLFASGKVPCCVDSRGADAVPENDSQGEWIYLLSQYYRYTRDIGFLTEYWPTVRKAVDYMAQLRGQRLSDTYREGRQRLFYGLMPQSISHKGYSSHPVHSYWDDFFSLLGMRDAKDLARAMGETGNAERYAALEKAFRKDLYASIALSMKRHGIDYIPGAAELGDFDATSTAIAVTPGRELQWLPRPALDRTFDTYNQIFEDRLDPASAWTGYTAYEVRIAGALVRMGHKARALRLLRFLVEDQRPPAWNQWPEVSWRDPRTPRFIGDMPHSWVGAEYIRSLRALLVYERDSDRSLVLAAGIPARWVSEGQGVSVRRLPTEYGVVHFSLRQTAPGEVALQLSGDLAMPPGKIRLVSPLAGPIV